MSDLQDLLDIQSGVISRRQAHDCGLSDGDIRRLVRRREWVRVHPGVFVTHTGALSWLQRAWAAVHYATPAALTRQSAVRAAEGPGRSGSDDDAPIHVAIAHARRLSGRPGVVVHRTTRLDERTSWNTSPPRVRLEQALLDLAIDEPDPWDRIELISRACRQRSTTAARLREALRDRARVSEREWLDALLADVAAGACSVLEHGYLTLVERPHGLPAAQRQRAVDATVGLIYRDAESHGVVIELDGRLFHDTTSQRDRDMDRDLDARVAGELTVRLGYGQVFRRACQTAERMGSLLQRSGWRGVPTPCGPDCPIGGSLPVTG